MDINQLKAQYKAGERNFKGVQLSGANLAWADLIGVNLQGADLSHTKFSGANLSESDLSGETNLTFADLSRADLRNTNLKGARLEGANLEGIQLEGAVYDETTKFPLGFDPSRAGVIASGVHPVTLSSQHEVAVLELEPDLDLEQETRPNAPIQRDRGESLPRVNPQPNRVQEIAQQVRHAANAVISDWQQSRPSQGNAPTAPQSISFLSESSLNTSGQGKSGVVPASIKGSWNWGAFLLPGFWPFSNQVWGCLWIWILGLIPGIGGFITVIFAITMAVNGNTWAWQSRKWNSIEAFKLHQRIWAIAGIVFWGLYLWIQMTSGK